MPMYVDSSLGEGVEGAEESRRIHEMGFGEVYLATGYEPAKFARLAHLRGVIGKGPPWEHVGIAPSWVSLRSCLGSAG